MPHKTLIKTKYNLVGLIILSITFVSVLFLFFLDFQIQDSDVMEPEVYKNSLNIFSRFQNPERKDIVVYLDGTGKKRIGRVIGLPSEDLVISSGEIYINGEILIESYLGEQKTFNVDFPKNGERLEIAENEYYILGDKRDVSYDSRYFGPVKDDQIVGKLLISI